MTNFIGREQELNSLEKLLKKKSASLVVVRGRRRIGKSRLIEEFAKKRTFYKFAGIAPTPETTMQSQLNEFASQLSIQTGLPEVSVNDWNKLFVLLAEKLKHGRIIVLFDEISWIGSKDSDFLGKLKNAWDLYFKNNPELIFILCGSSSIWIEENILSSTGFLGRISLRLRLDELSLPECKEFWGKSGSNIAAYEMFKILSVTGGIPRYLEEIKPSLTAEDNIKDLCFIKSGVLVNEFDEIFSDLFSKRSDTYKKIVKTLVNGRMEIKDICEKLDIERSGFISECLDDLLKAGFIKRDFTWNIDSTHASSLSHYRLSDNYVRFYLKYIDKYRDKIEEDAFVMKSLSSLPGWEVIMGLQFENLVLNNRKIIKDCLGVKSEEVVSDNPFFQRKTAKHDGCQIDYLIQNKFGVMYLCEIKFYKSRVGMEAVNEVKRKIQAFHYPRGFSIRPVLVHVNGVEDSVVDSDFFADIIDFSEWLQSS